MLLQLQDIDSQIQHFEKVVQLMKLCHEQLRNQSVDYAGDFPVKLIEKCVPKDVLLNIVHKFQNYITLVIIQSIFKQDTIQQVIQVLDFFHRANGAKPRAQ